MTREKPAAPAAALLVLAAYAALTALLTWPLVTRFGTALPGVTGDASTMVWNCWWTKYALVDLHTNPFTTDYIFHPRGISLVFHTFSFLNGLISIPLQSWFGLVAAQNTLIFAGFALSGLGAWLLIRHLTGNAAAAFVGGAIFAFCPYKFAHLQGHYNLISTQWIPFCVLFLVRLGTDETGPRVRHGLLAGLFLLLTAYTEFYYLFYLLFFLLFLLGFLFFTDRKRLMSRSFLKAAAALAAVFVIGFSPLLILAAGQAAAGEYPELHGSGGRTHYVADVFGFVTPWVLHPFLKGFAWAVSNHFRGNTVEWTVFIGYSVILLSLLGVVRYYRKLHSVKFWSLAALGFTVLSMGPYLRVLGKKVMPLPDYLLGKIPLVNHLRVPSRFNIMTMLCCGVLAAFGLSRLLGKMARRWQRTLVLTLVLSVVLFEYLSIPYPMWEASYPPVYDRIAADEESCTILEIPLGWSDGFRYLGPDGAHQMYYQTVHHKKEFGGRVARFPDNRVAYYRSMPLIGTVLRLEEQAVPEPVPAAERQEALATARRLHVKYIIIHRPHIDSPVHRYLTDVLPLVPLCRDNELVAYVMTPAP